MKLNPLAIALICAAFMQPVLAGDQTVTGLINYNSEINGFAIVAPSSDGASTDQVIFCLAGTDADKNYADDVKVQRFTDRETMLTAFAEFRGANDLHTVWVNGQEQIVLARRANESNPNLAKLVLNDDNLQGKATLSGKSIDIGVSNDPLSHVNAAVPLYIQVTKAYAEHGITPGSTSLELS